MATVTVGDTTVSQIRTAVPALVGTAIAVAAAHGLSIDPATASQITVLLIPLCISVYYGIVRMLEKKFPVVGWLLGLPAAPAYGTVGAPEPVVELAPANVPVNPDAPKVDPVPAVPGQ